MNRDEIIAEFEEKFGKSFYLEDTVRRDDELTDVEAIEKFLLSKIAEGEREALDEYEAHITANLTLVIGKTQDAFLIEKKVFWGLKNEALARRGIGEER